MTSPAIYQGYRLPPRATHGGPTRRWLAGRPAGTLESISRLNTHPLIDPLPKPGEDEPRLTRSQLLKAVTIDFAHAEATWLKSIAGSSNFSRGDAPTAIHCDVLRELEIDPTLIELENSAYIKRALTFASRCEPFITDSESIAAVPFDFRVQMGDNWQDGGLGYRYPHRQAADPPAAYPDSIDTLIRAVQDNAYTRWGNCVEAGRRFAIFANALYGLYADHFRSPPEWVHLTTDDGLHAFPSLPLKKMSLDVSLDTSNIGWQERDKDATHYHCDPLYVGAFSSIFGNAALALYRNGEYESSKELALRALAFGPHDFTANMTYASALVRRGDAEAGLLHRNFVLRQAETRESTFQFMDWQYEFGTSLLAMGEYQAALDLATSPPCQSRLNFAIIETEAHIGIGDFAAAHSAFAYLRPFCSETNPEITRLAAQLDAALAS